MKEYKEVLVDSFEDYAGRTRHFVIAALSQSVEDLAAVEYKEDDTFYRGYLVKCVKIGYSICNPIDKFDQKIGVLKAEARARKANPSIYATSKGIINSIMVKGILTQEAAYIKKNPEMYIKGYAESKAKWLKAKEKADIIRNFDSDEVMVYNKLNSDPKFVERLFKCLNLTNAKSH